MIDMIRHFSNNNKTRILQRFQHIKVVDRNSDFAYINHNNDSVLETLMGIDGYSDLLLEQLTQHTQMIGAVSLDMSRVGLCRNYGTYDEMDLAKALPRALSSFMVPNLRHLDISRTEMSENILEEFAIRCPYLEIVKRNNIMNFCNICANGYELRMMDNLKEIYFDNCAFHFDHGIKNEDRNDVDEYNVGDDFEVTQFAAMQDLEKFSDLFLFHKLLNKPLERVSIRNAGIGRCCEYPFGDGLRIPPDMLIKFVRNAQSTLKWFRSDLSKEHIQLLQLEKPGIQFIS